MLASTLRLVARLRQPHVLRPVHDRPLLPSGNGRAAAVPSGPAHAGAGRPLEHQLRSVLAGAVQRADRQHDLQQLRARLLHGGRRQYGVQRVPVRRLLRAGGRRERAPDLRELQGGDVQPGRGRVEQRVVRFVPSGFSQPNPGQLGREGLHVLFARFLSGDQRH